MPLRIPAKLTYENFNFPISYKIGENRQRMVDARNVFSNQDRLETRHGLSRFNSTALDSKALSLSFFKQGDDTIKVIAKTGTTLEDVKASGAHTELKSGLTSTTKHRAIDFNRGTKDRHIIGIDTDGLFSYDGSNFTQLGQAVPAAPTVASSGSGNTLTASDYQVAYTFYASTIGFETNIGAASATVTVSSGQQIDVSAIASTAANALIDKVRLYVKDVTNEGSFLFWAELSLGTTTDTIDANPTSTKTPPTKNGTPPASGKYLTEFESRLIVAGISVDKSAVYFSEPDLPDAFDNDGSTNTRLFITGGGPVTGVATGYFNDSALFSYLAVFKKYSTHIYTTSNGLVTIHREVGCVSHNTIKVINGDVYFLSSIGWMVIVNGRLYRKKNKVLTLSEGDIDDVFKSEGYTYQLNKTQFSNFFSVYYGELGHYLTFVAEGSNTSFNKAYNFEFEIGGFRTYTFNLNLSCGVEGEDSNGDQVIYLADSDGYVYTHSINEDRTDQDSAAASVNIESFALFNWITGDDMDATYNYGRLIFDALVNSNDITVKTWTGYNFSKLEEQDFSFTTENSGFILDVSKLDEGTFNDGRELVRSYGEVNRSGYNLLVGVYLTAANANLGLRRAQLFLQKNGSAN